MRRPFLALFFAAIAPISVGAEVDFDTEIVPLLSKAGCNAAACHGGAAGQAGFRLSLFGGDPALDYRMIVRELEGRRVDFVHPADSLLIAKPSGQLEHGGGDVIADDGKMAQTLAAWIREGARRPRLRKLKRLHVQPNRLEARQLPFTAQLEVIAEYDDGTRRDVTDIAVYTSLNDVALTVSSQGALTGTRPGRHSAIVRFDGHIHSVQVTTPLGKAPPEPASMVEHNFVDALINGTLRALQLTPGAPTSDTEFLRRVTLDLTGRLPTVDAQRAFDADRRADKRDHVIDRLLASAEFTEYWTHRMGSILRIQVPATDQTATEQFHAWLTKSVQGDVSWREMVAELIQAEGDTHEQGAATFHRFFATAREQAEYVSEVFMGVRMRCANCHNHPLDVWTQDDYHGLAQVFAGIERGKVIRFSSRGEVTHPRTGEPARVRLPGERFLDTSDARQAFTDWLTAPSNRYFARAMAGRIWEALMGRGLVTPTDDLRDTNPASHPDLLQKLSETFVAKDFRIRPLIKLICRSAAYQRSTDPENADPLYYSHALVKPLPAEVLADAIDDITGVPSSYDSLEVRAVALVDRRRAQEQLQFLGQCLPGEGGCNAAPAATRGLAARLHLMNGELLNEKITHPHGTLAKQLSDGSTAAELIDIWIRRALCRAPTSRERTLWLGQIQDDAGRLQPAAAEDFLWALLNSQEFITNH